MSIYRVLLFCELKEHLTHKLVYFKFVICLFIVYKDKSRPAMHFPLCDVLHVQSKVNNYNVSQ